MAVIHALHYTIILCQRLCKTLRPKGYIKYPMNICITYRSGCSSGYLDSVAVSHRHLKPRRPARNINRINSLHPDRTLNNTRFYMWRLKRDILPPLAHAVSLHRQTSLCIPDTRLQSPQLAQRGQLRELMLQLHALNGNCKLRHI